MLTLFFTLGCPCCGVNDNVIRCRLQRARGSLFLFRLVYLICIRHSLSISISQWELSADSSIIFVFPFLLSFSPNWIFINSLFFFFFFAPEIFLVHTWFLPAILPGGASLPSTHMPLSRNLVFLLPHAGTYLCTQLSELWRSTSRMWHISLLWPQIRRIPGGSLADRSSQAWLAACHSWVEIWGHPWASGRWHSGALFQRNDSMLFAFPQNRNGTESLYLTPKCNCATLDWHSPPLNDCV